jgi:hypothetical protein
VIDVASLAHRGSKPKEERADGANSRLPAHAIWPPQAPDREAKCHE